MDVRAKFSSRLAEWFAALQAGQNIRATQNVKGLNRAIVEAKAGMKKSEMHHNGINDVYHKRKHFSSKEH